MIDNILDYIKSINYRKSSNVDNANENFHHFFIHLKSEI